MHNYPFRKILLGITVLSFDHFIGCFYSFDPLLLLLLLQIITGIMLLVLGSMEGKNVEQRKAAHRLNDVTVGFVFAITIINIFIAAFGIKLSED